MYDRKLVEDYLIKSVKEIKEIEIFERELKIEFIPGKAISIIGPRRSGKTFFLKSVGKKFFKSPLYN